MKTLKAYLSESLLDNEDKIVNHSMTDVASALRSLGITVESYKENINKFMTAVKYNFKELEHPEKFKKYTDKIYLIRENATANDDGVYIYFVKNSIVYYTAIGYEYNTLGIRIRSLGLMNMRFYLDIAAKHEHKVYEISKDDLTLFTSILLEMKNKLGA